MASGLPAHVEEADLISYGLIGLISAIERFDLGREIKFETYAIPRIRGAIIDELRSLDWVPRSVRARAREIERANAKLEHKLQRAPTDEEMANELDMSMDEFQDALIQISNSTIAALDELWTVSDSSGDQISLLDTLHDPDAPDPEKIVDASELKDRVADAIARLPEREKLVIALYYYENLTLREIGEVLGVTESRISQLHTKAVLRLRSRLQGENGDARRPARRHRPGPAATRAGRYGRISSSPRGDPGMHKSADRIRNVALVGHRGSGKTSLHEALLFTAGAVSRLGTRDGRDDGLRRRRGREGAPDVDLGGADVVRVAGAQGQPARHAGRAELRRRRARRAARLRVGDLRRQRRDGRRGLDDAPVAARRRARPRAADVREHARPRAGRLLPHARRR